MLSVAAVACSDERVDDDGLNTIAADREPPSWEGSSLRIEYVRERSLGLGWSPAFDRQGEVHYEVRWNGSSLIVSGTQAVITGLVPATEYSIAVQAIDRSGNRSNEVLNVVAVTAGACETVKWAIPLAGDEVGR